MFTKNYITKCTRALTLNLEVLGSNPGGNFLAKLWLLRIGGKKIHFMIWPAEWNSENRQKSEKEKLT